MGEAIYLELFQHIGRDTYLEMLMNSGRVIQPGGHLPTVGINDQPGRRSRAGGYYYTGRYQNIGRGIYLGSYHTVYTHLQVTTHLQVHYTEMYIGVNFAITQ